MAADADGNAVFAGDPGVAAKGGDERVDLPVEAEIVARAQDDSRASWIEWNIWLHAHGLRDLKPAGALQFSQYDQLVQAAVNGQGVALGRLPLLRRMLRDKQLVTPFRKSVVSSRGYYVVRSTRAAGKQDVADFEAWLLEETKKDAAVKR